MNQRPSLRLNQKGWTLMELMIVTALIAIITPAITYLFTKATQGMAADEMHGQMQKLNELTMSRLHDRLALSKHFFPGNGSGVSFLAKLQLSSVPATLLNSKLAQAQTTTSGTPESLSPTSAASTLFGDSLLFGAYDIPATIGNKVYTAPATVTGAGVSYSDGTPATMVIDLYRFYYYYLSTNNDKGLSDVSSYRLVEWRSVQYADYYEIQDLLTGDAGLNQGVIKWLATPGNVCPANPSYAVTLAWDHTQNDPSLAFYKLSIGGTTTLLSPQTIVQSDWSYLTHISSGILGGGFKYGISGNTAGWKAAPATVPLYGTGTAPFPGGFEVGMTGTSSGVQILMRMLLVAEGASPRVVYNDMTSINNIRDIW